MRLTFLRLPCRLLIPLCAILCFCSALSAQDGRKIIVRMIDSKTGHLIPSSDFLVRVDHEQEADAHANWVKQNEDGTGTLVVPGKALLLSIEGKYMDSMEVYVNCDTGHDKPLPLTHWYSIDTILSTGLVAPNNCSKLKEIAKPGEFVFFVRKRNWKEQSQDFQP